MGQAGAVSAQRIAERRRGVGDPRALVGGVRWIEDGVMFFPPVAGIVPDAVAVDTGEADAEAGRCVVTGRICVWTRSRPPSPPRA